MNLTEYRIFEFEFRKKLLKKEFENKEIKNKTYIRETKEINDKIKNLTTIK